MFGFGNNNRAQAQQTVETHYREINRNNFIVRQGKQYLQGNIVSDNKTAIVKLNGNMIPMGLTVRVQVTKLFFPNNDVNTTIFIIDSKDRTIAKQTIKQSENDDISVMLNAALELAYKQ